MCNHLNGCDVYSTWNVPPILPFLSHVSYPLSLFRKNGWTQHTRWKIPIFFGGLLLLLLERPLDMINNPLRGGFLIFYYTVLHPDKNAILHELTGSYFYYSPLENHRYTNNVTFWKMLPSHYSKKEVFDLEKGFKICYVYVKRKPK